MAELADAHGSGPCEGNFMQVQLLLSAPENGQYIMYCPFLLCVDIIDWYAEYRMVHMNGKSQKPIDIFLFV